MPSPITFKNLLKRIFALLYRHFTVVSSQKLGQLSAKPSKSSQYRRKSYSLTWSCCSTANSRCPGRTSVTGSRGDCLPQAGTSWGRARVWRDLGQSVQGLLSPPLDGSGLLLPVLDPHPDTERGGEAGEHGALRQVAHVVQHALPGGQQLLQHNTSEH